MPRVARELSAIEVSRLTTPGFVAVGAVPGLHLQITPTGARTWVLRIKIGNKRRDMGLGGYPAVTLAQARESARAARAAIEAGEDPILQRQRTQSALRASQATEKTFRWCAQQFIDAHSDTWRNAKHRAQWGSTLETYAYPLIGAMLVRDVTQAHVLAVLEPIWREKTETAKRLRGRLEQVLDWATVRQFREGENPARWQGGLKMLLPSPGKIQRFEHHRALPIDGIGAFVQDLREKHGTVRASKGISAIGNCSLAVTLLLWIRPRPNYRFALSRAIVEFEDQTTTWGATTEEAECAAYDTYHLIAKGRVKATALSARST